jgi:hypothetical protein
MLERKLIGMGLLAALAVCLPAPAGAVGKTTVDPNASANTSQKVTYEARRKTVVSIFSDLSKMTGVTLRAGSICGCYFNVVVLPIYRLSEMLEEFGIRPLSNV